jgi:protein phosphatase inhibitor 2
MSSPRHSPPPSAAAPKPRGILKNASNGIAHSDANEAVIDSPPPTTINVQLNQNSENSNHLAWDESNLTLHEIQREQQDPRMKIDEPKTPFVRSASLGPMDDDTSEYFPQVILNLYLVMKYS